jgi:type II secretory ATPase GspE/PulE/Tfp pilus assembly ATPase PilB-like protein
MLDLGVEPYLLASSLLGVLAQRLTRQICSHCRTAFDSTAEDRAIWGITQEELAQTKLYRGKGCEACLHTGYHERRGIFEFLEINDAIRELILQCDTASNIKSVAISNGMTSLRSDGIKKAKAGLTTMDEVVRVSGRDEF